MTNARPLHWSQRSGSWVLLAATFVAGVFIGLMLAATWEVDRHVRESERRIADAMADISSRPTVHQRLDAIDQRLQAIEHRLTP